MSKRTRREPASAREALLAAALRVAARDGYRHTTREAVAREAGVSPGLVSHYLGTMPQLRRTVMRAAVDRGLLPVIAQGVVDRNPHALAAPLELRAAALNAVSGATT